MAVLDLSRGERYPSGLILLSRVVSSGADAKCRRDMLHQGFTLEPCPFALLCFRCLSQESCSCRCCSMTDVVFEPSRSRACT